MGHSRATGAVFTAMVVVTGIASCRSRSEPRTAVESAKAPTGAVILAEPSLVGGTPPARREGIGNTLTGRLVRTGERVPYSPFASWMRRERILRKFGREVSVWSSGSASSRAADAIALPRLPSRGAELTWILTSGVGELTSVLTVHESPTYFRRSAYDCADETEVAEARELKVGSRRLIWLELSERWFCRYNGNATPEPGGSTGPEVSGPLERDRRTAFLAVVEPDGVLRRLASGIPLVERGEGEPVGVLAAAVGDDGILRVAAVRDVTAEQRRWIGEHATDPIARRAGAVPSSIDEPLPDGDVLPACGEAPATGKLVVEVDPPFAIDAWIMNPEVLVLSVPRGTGRFALRAIAVAPDGGRTDVTLDGCLRFQVVGSGLGFAGQRGLFDVSSVDGASVLVFFRGQRRIVRLEAVAPLPPPIPEAATVLLSARFPGMRLSTQDGPRWNLLRTGPGQVVADLDRDGREDVAVVLRDAWRWRLVILRQGPGGRFDLAFEDGDDWQPKAPAEPADVLMFGRTSSGDISLSVERNDGERRRADEWIVRWRGDQFDRLTLPLLRFQSSYFGIVPGGPPARRGSSDVGALARALWEGEGEAFADAAALGSEGKKQLAAVLVAQLRAADGDRTKALAALAFLGEAAAESAVPYLAELHFPRGGRFARVWRKPTEESAATIALERMGEAALRVLVEHLDDNSAGLMAEAVVRDMPLLREMVPWEVRRNGLWTQIYAALALRSAPIETVADLDGTLAMLRGGGLPFESGVSRIATAAARSPRPPQLDALLARAVPALAERLTWGGKRAVCDALRLIGPPAKAAVPSLEAALLDPDCLVRVAARAAIAAIAGRPLRSSEAHSDTAVECPLRGSSLGAAPAGTTRAVGAPPASAPERMLVIRQVVRTDREGARFGFEPPLPVDWRQLGRRHLEGVTLDEADSASGRLVEEIRRRRETFYDGYVGGIVRFDAPIPRALSRLHYYAVTEAGVARIMPRRYEGIADITIAEDGPVARVRFRGHVDAEAGDTGFVLMSDSPLEVERSTDSREVVDLWPKILADEALAAGDERVEPRGFRFSLRYRGRTEEYLFAILPPDPTNCADRRRMFRVTGAQVKLVALLDADCDV